MTQLVAYRVYPKPMVSANTMWLLSRSRKFGQWKEII
jgi:hypothetical protein